MSKLRPPLGDGEPHNDDRGTPSPADDDGVLGLERQAHLPWNPQALQRWSALQKDACRSKRARAASTNCNERTDEQERS